MIEDNEEVDYDDAQIPIHAGFGAFDDDTAMEEPEADVAELGQLLCGEREDCESEKERLKFQQMIEDHRKLLYPECEDGLKKLGTTLELLQWKATYGVSDKGFGE